MLFVEGRFFLFFLLVFGVHWALRSRGARKTWLLGCSYAFYAGWDWRFLSLILISTGVDFLVAQRLERAGPGRPGLERKRRAWLILSLATNLGLLGFFKYYNFFVESGTDFLRTLGLQPGDVTLRIVLPVGISFYTFQTLSYTIDVYRRRLRPVDDLRDFALFVAFFPQLVAGPIVRAADFLPQLQVRRRFREHVAVRASLLLFLSGFVKKACISDNVAPLVDRYFAAPLDFDALSAWVATLGYAVQIYCDFSGYSDMAIACAGLLGFRLRDNFAWPYFAANITDFWRRWHISLSSWLRDYLYIPLGGNRGSRLFTYRNLMLTMLLGGLWHGAAWNFVIWGGLHGAALVVHREWVRRTDPAQAVRRVVALAAPLLTFGFACLCWIFFRAEGLRDALAVTRSFLLLSSPGEASVGLTLLYVFPFLVLAHGIARRGSFRRAVERLPDWGFALFYGAAWALALPAVSTGYQPFIYFQF